MKKKKRFQRVPLSMPIFFILRPFALSPRGTAFFFSFFAFFFSFPSSYIGVRREMEAEGGAAALRGDTDAGSKRNLSPGCETNPSSSPDCHSFIPFYLFFGLCSVAPGEARELRRADGGETRALTSGSSR